MVPIMSWVQDLIKRIYCFFHRHFNMSNSIQNTPMLCLISATTALSPDVDELNYLPFGTTTLKLRFDPPDDCPIGPLIASPLMRHQERERVIIGHEDNGSELWITWGGGKKDGLYFNPDDGQRYLYFNLFHRGNVISSELPLTIQIKTPQGKLVAERRFMLYPPAHRPVRLDWEGDWPFGSTLQWEGERVPSYQSRWWPEQRLTFEKRELPPFRLRYDRLVTDNQWGRVTLSLLDADEGEQVLARVDGRLESALHDVRLFDADLFHFYGDVWAVRLWFSWLHTHFTEDDIHPDLQSHATPTVRESREEVPDAERFDLLIDVKNRFVTHIGTDNHYKELWGTWYYDTPVQVRIGHNKSMRTILFILSARASDTFASLTSSRKDDYNPAAVIREQMEHGHRALSFEEIRESLSWEAHAPIVDDFSVPGELIGPDVRVTTLS